MLVRVGGWMGGGAGDWDNNAKPRPQLGCCFSWGLAWQNWQACLMENLKPQDRMKVEPIQLRLKDDNARLTFCTCPHDTPQGQTSTGVL